jgi:tetratricopeptide (TPR) repeat protein
MGGVSQEWLLGGAMYSLRRIAVVGSCVVAWAGPATAQVGPSKAAQAFKDANRFYQQQDYSRAAEKYEEAVQLDPSLPAVYFYLANSYDNLYRPSRKGESQNDEWLRRAVENYRKSADIDKDPRLKKLAREYLVAAYGPDKMDDPGEAIPVLEEMIAQDPTDPATYFVLAKIWEDGGDYEVAEEYLLKAKEARPEDKNVYIQLAGFYNRCGEFAKTMKALQERSDLEPTDPAGHYTVASYYWEKAYRDFRLRDSEKLDYIERGLKAADRALELQADYPEALTYKNLLLRSRALLTPDPMEQQALIEEADRLRDKAMELRKKK